MGNQMLYRMLLKRLQDDGAFHPPFIGEFACEDALPRRRRYPPLYAWIDGDGGLHIDTDRAALSRICVLESIRAGRPVAFGDPEVERAVARFREMARREFEATMRHMAVSLQARKRERATARERSAERWAMGTR